MSSTRSDLSHLAISSALLTVAESERSCAFTPLWITFVSIISRVGPLSPLPARWTSSETKSPTSGSHGIPCLRRESNFSLVRMRKS